MANRQRTVLHRHSVSFRPLPAFAKGGQERYGLTPDTQVGFEACLSESTDPDWTFLLLCLAGPAGDNTARYASR